jgi:threonine dehydrogenase-like Zn-dependent dehydrogenase
VEALQRLTGGTGPDCAIDAVGVDAYHAHSGPAAEEAKAQEADFQEQQQKIAPEQNPTGGNWVPGNAPSQVGLWSVKSLAKAGTLSIIGVYPPNDQFFPIGAAMNKNLRINMGNCNHRKYLPHLVELVRIGAIEPLEVLTQQEPMAGVLDAYKAFDQRRPGWIKVELNPSR